jgi:hypothetical protein
MLEGIMTKRHRSADFSLNSGRRRLNILSFVSFRERFTEQIGATDFGEPPASRPPIGIPPRSPASRELLRAGLSDSLRENAFLRKIYRLAIEHARLESERPRVRRFAKALRPHIKEHRNAQKRLATAARELRGAFLTKYGTILGGKLVQAVQLVAEELENIRHSLQRREKLLVSRIPPVARREGDEPSGWQLILKEVDYELPRATVKAVDQWFYESVNLKLNGLIQAKRNRRLSETTRMKLISAICNAAGIGLVQPTTIKQYFRSKMKLKAN